MKRTRPFPAGDACRLLLAKDHVSDVDEALAFLGLARSVVPVVTKREEEPPQESVLEDVLEDPSLESLQEVSEQPDEFEESEELYDRDDAFPEIARGWPSEKRPGWSADGRHHDGKGDDDSSIWPFIAAERSMIAYMLTPDERAADRQAEQPAWHYTSVPDRVQQLTPPAPTPDAESWRVARQVIDGGPKISREGKIDLRECVFRISRREGLDRLPRVKALTHVKEIRFLIDWRLFRGPFTSDVNQLERAVRSAFPARCEQTCVLVRRGRLWLTGPGPIWTLVPFVPATTSTWYVVVAGGEAATPENLEVWNHFVASIGARHSVTFVWLGDSLRARLTQDGRSRASFRV
jgi:hypothetical protein